MGSTGRGSCGFPAQIVPNDPKVVEGYVGELRAAGAFPDRPDFGRGRFQALIDSDVAATVHLHTGLLEPDAGGIGNTPCRDQDVATLDFLLA